MSLPDPAPVLDLIDAFRRSKTMFTAVSMGIFDYLANQPASAADLAATLKANPDALERLLDGCAALGFLSKQNGTYANLPVADVYLRKASPESMGGYIRYSDRALYAMWGNLESAVKEGTHRWTQTFGGDGPIFSHFFRTDDAMREFLLGMHGFGRLTSPKVVNVFDLSRFRRLVDLGGATGHLTIAACERYPDLHGVVFDLPRVTSFAREQVALSAARDRIEVVEGDFFDDNFPDADLYAVGRILHDWTDDKIAKLLAKAYQHLPSGGGMLVAEKLLNADGVGPVPVNMQSLNMLICTEGKERPVEDYARLLTAAGFTAIEGRRTGTALDAVLATKS